MSEERLHEIEVTVGSCWNGLHRSGMTELIAEVRRLQDLNAIQSVALLAANERCVRLEGRLADASIPL